MAVRYPGLGRNQEQTRFDGTLDGALLRFGNGRMGSRDALRQLGKFGSATRPSLGPSSFCMAGLGAAFQPCKNFVLPPAGAVRPAWRNWNLRGEKLKLLKPR